MGSRLLKFLSQVLPTHSHYHSTEEEIASLRLESHRIYDRVRQIVHCLEIDLDVMIHQRVMESAGMDYPKRILTPPRFSGGGEDGNAGSDETKRRVRFAKGTIFHCNPDIVQDQEEKEEEVSQSLDCFFDPVLETNELNVQSPTTQSSTSLELIPSTTQSTTSHYSLNYPNHNSNNESVDIIPVCSHDCSWTDWDPSCKSIVTPLDTSFSSESTSSTTTASMTHTSGSSSLDSTQEEFLTSSCTSNVSATIEEEKSVSYHSLQMAKMAKTIDSTRSFVCKDTPQDQQEGAWLDFGTQFSSEWETGWSNDWTNNSVQEKSQVMEKKSGGDGIVEESDTVRECIDYVENGLPSSQEITIGSKMEKSLEVKFQEDHIGPMLVKGQESIEDDHTLGIEPLEFNTIVDESEDVSVESGDTSDCNEFNNDEEDEISTYSSDSDESESLESLPFVQKIAIENYHFRIDELREEDDADSDAADSWAQENNFEADIDPESAIDLDSAVEDGLSNLNIATVEKCEGAKDEQSDDTCNLDHSDVANGESTEKGERQLSIIHSFHEVNDNEDDNQSDPSKLVEHFEHHNDSSHNSESDDETEHERFVKEMTQLEFSDDVSPCDSSGGDKTIVTAVTAETEESTIVNDSGSESTEEVFEYVNDGANVLGALRRKGYEPTFDSQDRSKGSQSAEIPSKLDFLESKVKDLREKKEKRNLIRSYSQNTNADSKEDIEGRRKDPLYPIQMARIKTGSDGVVSELEQKNKYDLQRQSSPVPEVDEHFNGAGNLSSNPTKAKAEIKSKLHSVPAIERPSSSRTRYSKAARLRKIKNTAAWKRRYGTSNMERSEA